MRKCFAYRLPTEALHPIGSAYAELPEFYDVQVVATKWSAELEESIKSLTPKSVDDLIGWIEQSKKDYEADIAPETVRDRIDPAWLDRVRWFAEDGRIHRRGDPKSQWKKAAQERQYDELGFAAFLCLRHVYIDPALSRTCMLFSALLDVHFENHGFGLHHCPDGTVVNIIDQIFYRLAEHAKY